MVCKNCGALLSDGKKECPICGNIFETPVNNANNQPSDNQPQTGTNYQQPQTGTGYQQPHTGTGYQQPQTGTGYQQPQTNISYQQYNTGHQQQTNTGYQQYNTDYQQPQNGMYNTESTPIDGDKFDIKVFGNVVTINGVQQQPMFCFIGERNGQFFAVKRDHDRYWTQGAVVLTHQYVILFKKFRFHVPAFHMFFEKAAPWKVIPYAWIPRIIAPRVTNDGSYLTIYAANSESLDLYSTTPCLNQIFQVISRQVIH